MSVVVPTNVTLMRNAPIHTAAISVPAILVRISEN